MRQLASVQKVLELKPIPNYDRIEVARILGWDVIVQKDQFKVGDLCIYVEVDSVLPEREEFEFLRKRCWSSKYNGFRIKAMKMAGIYSFGIVFPLSIIKYSVIEGMDVTDILGIKKYDEEEVVEVSVPKKTSWIKKWLIRLGIIRPNRKNSNFPNFFSKTDETRLQAIPHILDYFNDKPIYITEKLDGSSMSIFYYKKKFGVCSRNLEVYKGKNTFIGNSYWNAVDRYGLNKLFKQLKLNIVIQGEIIGPNIQKNKYKLDTVDFYVYQVFDIDKQRYYDFEEFKYFCNMCNLKMVPLLYYGVMNKSVDEWISFSIDISTLADIQREGIVVRLVNEETIPFAQTVRNRSSFKVINPEFVLANQ